MPSHTFSAPTRRPQPRRALAAAALAGTLLSLTPALAQAQAPAPTPTLGSSITTAWSDFATPAGGGGDTTGLTAAAAPNGGVDAFEFAGIKPTLSASRTRTPGGEWATIDDAPIFKTKQIINASRSEYGTLMGYVVATDTTQSIEKLTVQGAIRLPDATWITTPELNLGTTSYQGTISPRFTLGADGTVVFTATTTNSIGVSVWQPGNGAWTKVATVGLRAPGPLGPARQCASSPTAAVLPNTGVIYVACPVADMSLVVVGDVDLVDGTVNGRFEVNVDGTFLPGQLPGTTAMEADALENNVYLALRALPSMTTARVAPASTGARLLLLDLEPGDTQTTDLGAAAPGSITPQTEILTGAAGNVTVVQGGRDSGTEYSLIAAEHTDDGDGIRTLMTGAAGGFDAYQDADGKQYVLWHRADTLPDAPVGPGFHPWPTTTDAVAVHTRADVYSQWGTPEVLSLTARAFSQYYRSATLAPVLQASGSSLHALWFENNASGDGSTDLTEATFGAAPTPVDPGPGGGSTGGTKPTGTTTGTKPVATTPASSAPLTQPAVGSRTLAINVLLRPSGKPRKCPNRITVRVRKLRSNGTLASSVLAIDARQLTTTLVSGGCQLTGTITLARAQKAGTNVGVTISAIGYRVRAPRITLK